MEFLVANIYVLYGIIFLFGFTVGRFSKKVKLYTPDRIQSWIDKQHIHEWTKWSDEKTLSTSTGFNSTKKITQDRKCKKCGYIQSREVSKVEST